MTCSACAGKGITLIVVVIVDPDTGEMTTKEVAGPCRECGGTGKV